MSLVGAVPDENLHCLRCGEIVIQGPGARDRYVLVPVDQRHDFRLKCARCGYRMGLYQVERVPNIAPGASAA